MTKPLSVLHVIDHLGPGGAQAVVRDLVGALGHEFRFEVAVLGRAGTFDRAFAALNIPVHYLGAGKSRWDPSTYVQLSRLIESRDYQIVHAHLHKSCILAGLGARRYKRHLIIHDHTGIYAPFVKPYIPNPVLRGAYLATFRHILDNVSYAIVLNPEMRSRYISVYRLAQAKVQLIPIPVDLGAFACEAAPLQSLRQQLNIRQGKIVLMIGRLEFEKDWDTFLNVAKLVGRRIPTAFIIAGSGAEQKHLEARIERENLKNIHLIGYRHDVSALLAQTDVFLLTSRQDASPVVLLEAMASRRAVVSTRTVGARNILSDGSDGLIAEIGDAEGLAQRVEYFLSDPARAREYGKRARAKIEQHYSLEVVARKLAELYQTLGDG